MENKRYFELLEIYNLMFHENFPNMLFKNYSINEQIQILEECIKITNHISRIIYMRIQM